jgi:hypothetical protein
MGIPKLSSQQILGAITVAVTSGAVPRLVPLRVIHGIDAPGSPGSDPQAFKLSESNAVLVDVPKAVNTPPWSGTGSGLFWQ